MNSTDVHCNLCHSLLDCVFSVNKRLVLQNGISLNNSFWPFLVGNDPESKIHLCFRCVRQLKIVLADVDPDKIGDVEMSDWISVEERLPEEDGLVLIHTPSGDPDKPLVVTAWYDPSGRGWTQLPGQWIDAITHWQPLPEPPETK